MTGPEEEETWDRTHSMFVEAAMASAGGGDQDSTSMSHSQHHWNSPRWSSGSSWNTPPPYKTISKTTTTKKMMTTPMLTMITIEYIWDKVDTLYESGGSSNLARALMTAIKNNKAIVSADHELYLSLWQHSPPFLVWSNFGHCFVIQPWFANGLARVTRWYQYYCCKKWWRLLVPCRTKRRCLQGSRWKTQGVPKPPQEMHWWQSCENPCSTRWS